MLLRALHVAGLIAWFGTAFADAVLELTLARTREREARRVLVELHRRVDVFIEGPAAIVVLVTGALLLRAGGWLERPLPGWLAWKIGCGAAAAAINLACTGFVIARSRALAAAPESADARAVTRRWDALITASGIGFPLGIAAFYLAFARGLE